MKEPIMEVVCYRFYRSISGAHMPSFLNTQWRHMFSHFSNLPTFLYTCQHFWQRLSRIAYLHSFVFIGINVITCIRSRPVIWSIPPWMAPFSVLVFDWHLISGWDMEFLQILPTEKRREYPICKGKGYTGQLYKRNVVGFWENIYFYFLFLKFSSVRLHLDALISLSTINMVLIFSTPRSNDL